MSLFKVAVLIAALTVLSGCGFRPLYAKRADGGSTAAALESIVIGPIPGRLGQVLRNDLLDRLTPRGPQAPARYRLDIALSSVRESLAIKKDEEITRSNLRLTANFVLSDPENGETVLKGQTRSIASFNIVRSDFANLVARQDAERRAARQISDQIVTRLSLYFGRRRAA